MQGKTNSFKITAIKLNPAKWKRTVMDSGVRNARYLILGRELNRGLLFKLFLYWILIITSYIYLNPVLKMLVKMVMNHRDLVNPAVTWIPRELYWGHLAKAWNALQYGRTLFISIAVSGLSAFFHVITCGMMGYALARMQFRLKKLLFFLLIMAFIIPPQVTILPLIMMYTELGFQNHLVSILIPSIFGFGVKGALFVIIYRQFFMTQPKELEEAAKIDGASAFRFYWKVMFPLAKPAILVVSIFSFVWTWNDTYFPSMFLSGANDVPLALQMSRLDTSIKAMLTKEDAPEVMIESIKMAASFLVILPPLVIFFLVQRFFVESVERAGLVE
ncbi:carbohydrate ABC transporter permease [Paenibacillus sp. MBLB4367]|uniref:carbohydrate ABC transporter permease n=1 Tax=Paenibacillus sp. MBLB4367 TaxID=3384767 RepID=UPI00390844CB